MDWREFLERAQKIDRRWIFLMIALSVIIPLGFEMRLPALLATCEVPDGIERTDQCATNEVQSLYDFIERGRSDGQPLRVLLSFDFDPPSEPELLPMATSYVRHLALRGHKMYLMSLWPVGPQEVQNVVEEVMLIEHPNLEYGVDYVSLGFKTGSQGVIQGVVSDFTRQYSTDINGTAVADIPMMEGINELADFDLVLNVSAGYPGLKEWVQFGGDPSGVPVAGGVTAVSAPLLYPYFPNQLLGLMGGMQSATEYETLLMANYPEHCWEVAAEGSTEDGEGTGEAASGTMCYGDTEAHTAMAYMGPQTFAHVVIILFIIIGNVAFFANRRRGGTSA